MVEPGIRREKLQRPRGRSRASKSEALLSASPAAADFFGGRTHFASGSSANQAAIDSHLHDYLATSRARVNGESHLHGAGRSHRGYSPSLIIFHRSHPLEITSQPAFQSA